MAVWPVAMLPPLIACSASKLTEVPVCVATEMCNGNAKSVFCILLVLFFIIKMKACLIFIILLF